MDYFELISRNIFVPIYNWKFGINYKSILKSLNESQFYSPEQIKEIQWIKIKEIIEHAFQNNQFYQSKFKNAGIFPGDIKNLDDFSKIPFLTKDEIKTNLDKLVTKNYSINKMHHKRTGGSTGTPLHLYVDNQAMNFKRAATHRHNSWAKYFPGSKAAYLWGDTDKKRSIKEFLYMKLYERILYLDTLKMDDASLADFLIKFNKYKPRVLVGHGHSLYFLAKHIKNNQSSINKLEGIISTAETLFDNERKVVEEVFGEIVYDRYGCEELSIIASECDAHDGLHINSEGLYVEVLNGDETNPGELIITDLVNKGMPFIRYKIMDMATLLSKNCSCGRGLPRLGKVYGRVTDFLYTPEGNRISGVSILDTFIIHIEGFKQVQIIQNEIDLLEFLIIKDNKFSQTSIDKLAQTVHTVFGTKMNHNITFVDEIKKTSRGKFQFTICNLKKN